MYRTCTSLITIFRGPGNFVVYSRVDLLKNEAFKMKNY